MKVSIIIKRTYIEDCMKVSIVNIRTYIEDCIKVSIIKREHRGLVSK